MNICVCLFCIFIPFIFWNQGVSTLWYVDASNTRAEWVTCTVHCVFILFACRWLHKYIIINESSTRFAASQLYPSWYFQGKISTSFTIFINNTVIICITITLLLTMIIVIQKETPLWKFKQWMLCMPTNCLHSKIVNW